MAEKLFGIPSATLPLMPGEQTEFQGDGAFRGALSIMALATPATPTITNEGTVGEVTYGYKVVATVDGRDSVASAEGTTATGHATLDGTNYNVVTWARVAGATGYKVYRTTGGTTPPMLIATITSGNTVTYSDQDKTSGSAETPSIVNNTGGLTVARPLLPELLSGGSLFNLPSTIAQWTAANTGSGSSDTEGADAVRVLSGATGPSTAVLYSTITNLNRAGANYYNVNWDKELWLFFWLYRQIADANGVTYVQLKEATTHGDLAAKGIGIKIKNLAVFGETYGTGREETASAFATLTTLVAERFLIRHIPGVGVNFYAGADLTTVLATTTDIPSGLAGGVSRFMLSIGNAGSAVDIRASIAHIHGWQAA